MENPRPDGSHVSACERDYVGGVRPKAERTRRDLNLGRSLRSLPVSNPAAVATSLLTFVAEVADPTGIRHAL